METLNGRICMDHFKEASKAGRLIEPHQTVRKRARSICTCSICVREKSTHSSQYPKGTTYAPKPSKHPELYMDTITFLAENCLFKIPRKPLEEESTVFRDMFLLPQSENEMMEGQDDAGPVVLQGVSKDDFECLLKVLLCRAFGPNLDLPLGLTRQWISVLKLSTMWEFTNLRMTAMCWLDNDATLDHVEKIVLATQYGIKQWLLPSLFALAQRPDPISVEEGTRLGIETALKLASVREQLKLESVYGYDAKRGSELLQKVFEL